MNRYAKVRPSCKTCDFWNASSGACGNRKSVYVGDIHSADFGCVYYGPHIHKGCGGLLEARKHANVMEHYCYGCMFTVLIDGKPIEETREWLKGGANENSKNKRKNN